MNYWHVESCNLSECHLPLFELLKKVQKNGRYTAREMYGCRGFVAHHNTDIHGDTAPQDTWYPGTYLGDGRLMEWMEEYREAEPGHRHISHLYGLYPAGEITADGTPELAEACHRTLEYRLAHGGGHTGWSRAWITNHYVSLWDAEAAYDNIRKMLEVSTYPNLFDKHPPFQIDGNFGICAAMNSMLAQSNEERIGLLPALPAAWKTGTVRGHAFGGQSGACHDLAGQQAHRSCFSGRFGCGHCGKI